MIEQQIRADAHEICQWEEYRFVMPPFSSVGGIARIKQAFGGDDGLTRLLRSINAAVFDDAGSGETAANRKPL